MASTTAGLMNETAAIQARPWGVARAFGYGLIVVAVYVVTQIAIVFAYGIGMSLRGDEFELGVWRIELDGLYLALATIGTTFVCLPLMRYLVARREPAPWRFLGFVPVERSVLAKWCLTLAVLIGLTDLLTVSLGRPLVPEFMTEVYARSIPTLLLVALVVAAPLVEETFFRGFVLATLAASRVPATVAGIFSALFWSVMHLQYDLYGMTLIFAMGCLLAFVRARSGSLVPCIVMHGLANLIAFGETVWLGSMENAS